MEKASVLYSLNLLRRIGEKKSADEGDHKAMRLKKQEKIAITEAIHNEDPTADIYLFGSRLDDARKGGDIDLYVETDIHEKLLSCKARTLRKIWERIGVQRIDIILKTRGVPLNAIQRLAKKTGTRL